MKCVSEVYLQIIGAWNRYCKKKAWREVLLPVYSWCTHALCPTTNCCSRRHTYIQMAIHPTFKCCFCFNTRYFAYLLERSRVETVATVIPSLGLPLVPKTWMSNIYIYYIPPPLTVHFSMTRSVRYQPILHTLYYTLHTEHAYCRSYRFFNNAVTTTVIEIDEMFEILDGRLGQRSVEQVRYVINNLLHLVIVKYGVISLVLCISTRLRLVTILSLLVKYLVIFHADPCNKSYICISTVSVRTGLFYFNCNLLTWEHASLAQLILRTVPHILYKARLVRILHVCIIYSFKGVTTLKVGKKN